MCNGNSSRAQNTKCHPNFHSEVAHAEMTALRSPASAFDRLEHFQSQGKK